MSNPAPTQIALIPFDDQQIMTLKNDDGVFVVMKPIVEALGLDWAAQRRRISNHPILSKGMALKAIPSGGGLQEAVTLELEAFHGWLVTVSPDRVADEDTRAAILRYQERAFRVIFEHFHGPIGKSASRRAVSATIAMQNQAMRIMQRLQRTGNADERRAMHGLLTQLCGELGIETPPLDRLGKNAPPAADPTGPFWDAVDALRASGIAVDHSRVPDRIALSLSDLNRQFAAAGIACHIDGRLKAALRQSDTPRFIANTAVNSALAGKTKTCWIFERRAQPDLLAER